MDDHQTHLKELDALSKTLSELQAEMVQRSGKAPYILVCDNCGPYIHKKTKFIVFDIKLMLGAQS